MQKIRIAILIILIILIIAGTFLAFSPQNQTPTSTTTQSAGGIKLSDSIPLPKVGERFDHMSVNLQSQRMYITARGNNSVYVVDLITEGITHIITGLDEPQGVVYVPQNNELFVSNGGDGSVNVYGASNYSLVDKLQFPGDADNMRLSGTLLYIGYGVDNQSGIAIVDTTSNKIVGNLHLEGHPESFVVEENGTKMYVNVPTTNSIEVVELANDSVISTWNTGSMSANFPMTLDEKDHRLFVGFWSPAQLVVYDTNTGSIITKLNIPSDADDLYYYSNTIFASCGSGYVAIILQQSQNNYQLNQTIPTTPLARTSLLVPQMAKYFVAAPQSGDQSAQLLIFTIP